MIGRSRILRAAAIACAAAALAGPAWAAKNVSARGWSHTEFGRLVFEWNGPVRHSASLSGTKLVVRFDSPITAPLKEMRTALSGYVRALALSRDRKTLTVTTSGRYTLRQLARGKIVIVDLVRSDAGPKTPPKAPAKPPAKAKATKTETELAVRTGETDRYGRVVFAWKTPVDYTVRKTGEDVVVSFRRGARIDVAKVRRGLPKQIGGIDVSRRSGKLQVRLRVAADARPRHFRNGTDVVVDVIGAPPKTATAPTK